MQPLVAFNALYPALILYLLIIITNGIMNIDIANIRKDYTLKELNESDVNKNPFIQFEVWWHEAVESKIDEVNAMTLATVNANGQPAARIVLLKDFSDNGFTFFTNYESAKGKELQLNHKAAVCFFWKELQRQVRIEGSIKKVDDSVNDEYFGTRPRGSQLGAWASPQSQVINNRSILEENLKHYEQRFAHVVDRPSHWGGYILQPHYFEFWQGRSNRLHDRIIYTKENNTWVIERLAP